MTIVPLKKNDIIPLDIVSCSLDGSGIGRHEGMAVFVPAAAAGDRLLVHILKVKSNIAFGKIHQIIERFRNAAAAYSDT